MTRVEKHEKIKKMVLKLVADVLTVSRVLIALIIATGVLTGLSYTNVFILLVIGWFTDLIDGILARKSGLVNWISERDKDADSLLGLSLMVYMMSHGYVNLVLGTIFIVAWFLVMVFAYENPTLRISMLIIVYALNFWVGFFESKTGFIIAVAYCLFALIVDHERFAQLVKEFSGVKH